MKGNAGMVHCVIGWTRGVQVKLWDPLRTRAIPERLRGVITTRRYTTPRLRCLTITKLLRHGETVWMFQMPLLGKKVRRYMSCACLSPANDSCITCACGEFQDATFGPLARRRLHERMSEHDVEAWLDDLSMIADCDLSRSLIEKNHEVFTYLLIHCVCISAFDFGDFMPSLKQINLSSLELRRLHADLIMCYKILFGLVKLSYSDFFTLSSVTVTRGHRYKLYVKRSQGVRKQFFAERIVAPWNCLSWS